MNALLLDEPQPRRRTILVLRPGALGDTLLALPALRALRQRFAARALHLVGHAGAGQLLAAAGEVDGHSDFDSPELTGLFAQDTAVPLLERLAPIEVAVAWLADPGGAVAAHLRARAAGPVLVAPSRPPAGSGQHASDYLLASLAPLGAVAPGWRPLRLPAPPRAAGETPVGVVCFDLLVHPGSGSPAKNWPPQAFAAVLELLRGARPLRAALLCGPADAEACAALATRLAPAPLILRPASVIELARLLAAARAYLGNDSGVSHLAAALGTPTVALFGPTDPRVWAPRAPLARVLPFDSSPAAVAEAVGRALAPEGQPRPSPA